MVKHSEMKASLEFAGVATNCSNFYCSKTTYKGSERFEPLKGGLAPENLKNNIYSDSVLEAPV